MTTEPNSTTNDVELQPFQPLGRYGYPAKPAKETLRDLYDRLVQRFRPDDEAPFISNDKMHSASSELLDAVTRSSSPSWLRRELDLTLQDLSQNAKEQDKLRVIVLPPCGQRNLLRHWAQDHDCAVLDPPNRNRLLDEPKEDFALPKIKTGKILVIPDLERWYLRHLDGLRHVEVLLRAVEASSLQIIIGCNSFAWAYLSKAVEADMVLPRPAMFRAFDGKRTAAMLKDLAESDAQDAAKIRFSRSGSQVFPGDGDGDEQLTFFKKLAAQSYGIPSVAWHMWRSSLRRSNEKEAEEVEENSNEVGNDQPFWVSSLPVFKMPFGSDEKTLLILHSLLLHGELSLEELGLVLPLTGYSASLHSLRDAGLVRQRDNGNWACCAIAYPFIHDNLADAGLPTDKL